MNTTREKPVPKIHEPYCAGSIPHDSGGCGGYVRCRGCGRRFGWCSGMANDHGFCNGCHPDLDKQAPQPRLESHEVAIVRGDDGRFRRLDVSVGTQLSQDDRRLLQAAGA